MTVANKVKRVVSISAGTMEHISISKTVRCMVRCAYLAPYRDRPIPKYESWDKLAAYRGITE